MPSSSSAQQQEEKRLKRIRNKCPQKAQERMTRAIREDYKLVNRPIVDKQALTCKLVLLGSTGNSYKVNFGRNPTCTCPDHAKGNTTCKHILFVTTQIMGINPGHKLAYQAAYLGHELKGMYANVEKPGVWNRFKADQSVRRDYSKTGQSLEARMAQVRNSSTTPPRDEHYVNYGKLQGLSAERDRSTYRPFHWEERPQYRRYK